MMRVTEKVVWLSFCREVRLHRQVAEAGREADGVLGHGGGAEQPREVQGRLRQRRLQEHIGNLKLFSVRGATQIIVPLGGCVI